MEEVKKDLYRYIELFYNRKRLFCARWSNAYG